MALRSQQVVAYETNVCDTIDPLAGSYYIEKLTDEVEARAQEYIDQIDRMGGAVAAIEKGFIQKEIGASAYRFQREIEKGERIIVGLNRFQTHEDKLTGLLKVDPEVGAKQVARLQELKNTRDNAAVQQALAELKTAAAGHRQPDAAHPEGGQGPGHPGRGLRHPAGGLRRIRSPGADIEDSCQQVSFQRSEARDV